MSESKFMRESSLIGIRRVCAECRCAEVDLNVCSRPGCGSGVFVPCAPGEKVLLWEDIEGELVDLEAEAVLLDLEAEELREEADSLDAEKRRKEAREVRSQANRITLQARIKRMALRSLAKRAELLGIFVEGGADV